MFNLNKIQIGWLQALLNVLLFWGISNVYMAYNTQIVGVNKVMFALSTYASCAFCLLAYAGYGKLSKETIRSVDTWAYGIIMLLNYFITLNLYSLTTATEASLIQRFSVVFSVLISWLFLLRSPNKYQIIGVLLIFSGVIYVLNSSSDENMFYLSILMVLAGIFQSLRIFIAELHRANKKASEDNSLKTRCRVIGYVMFVITLIFGSIVCFATYLQEYVPSAYKINLVIGYDDLFSYQSILAGMIMGVFIYTPIRYLEFAASERIKTENYLAVTALSFFSTIFWEWSTQGITGLSLKEFSTESFIAGIVITFGAAVMSISKMLKSNKYNVVKDSLSTNPQNIDDIDETREIIANSLHHFNSNVKKVANALDVDILLIEEILSDKNKILSFNESILKKVAKNYRKNITTLDSLTGLLNKSAFINKLKSSSIDVSSLSLFFIDLNKFKPVNDKYGHDAGDYVLSMVATRLKQLFSKNSLITRLGGDEYCILLLNTTKKQAEMEILNISNILEDDIVYKNYIINISGSIGLASYPEDTNNVEDLIKIADKQMYKDKSER